MNREYVSDIVKHITEKMKELNVTNNTFVSQAISCYETYFYKCPYYVDRKKDGTFETVCSVSGDVLADTSKHNYYCAFLTGLDGQYLLRVCLNNENKKAVKEIKDFFNKFYDHLGSFNCPSLGVVQRNGGYVSYDGIFKMPNKSILQKNTLLYALTDLEIRVDDETQD